MKLISKVAASGKTAVIDLSYAEIRKWERQVQHNDLLIKVAIGVFTLVINICVGYLYYVW